jgi:hypothetical protein
MEALIMDDVERIASEVLRAAGSNLKNYIPQNQKKILSATTAAIAAMEGWIPISKKPDKPMSVVYLLPCDDPSEVKLDDWRELAERTAIGFYDGRNWLEARTAHDVFEAWRGGYVPTHWCPIPTPPQHGDEDDR